MFCKSDNRWGRPSAFRILDHARRFSLHHGHTRICRAQVNTDHRACQRAQEEIFSKRTATHAPLALEFILLAIIDRWRDWKRLLTGKIVKWRRPTVWLPMRTDARRVRTTANMVVRGKCRASLEIFFGDYVITASGTSASGGFTQMADKPQSRGGYGEVRANIDIKRLNSFLGECVPAIETPVNVKQFKVGITTPTSTHRYQNTSVWTGTIFTIPREFKTLSALRHHSPTQRIF